MDSCRNAQPATVASNGATIEQPRTCVVVWQGGLGGTTLAPRIGGTLTTSFDLTGYAEAALAFSEWSQVEATATFDRTRVQASTDGTTWIMVFESHGTSGAWAQRVVDVTAYAGQRMQLRFYFETRDPVLNDFEGWYVDDVKVIGLQPTGFVADFTATQPSASRRCSSHSLTDRMPPVRQ